MPMVLSLFNSGHGGDFCSHLGTVLSGHGCICIHVLGRISDGADVGRLTLSLLEPGFELIPSVLAKQTLVASVAAPSQSELGVGHMASVLAKQTLSAAVAADGLSAVCGWPIMVAFYYTALMVGYGTLSARARNRAHSICSREASSNCRLQHSLRQSQES